ncbi:dTDP-4-dehydrorhamnose reductase [Agrobacterium cavarae]|uniref:dTDP-4-dehydrorhamnose reductase n=1 Tax=Agrobacterium cavarae TaxID=2528239 RepID=UPI003FCEFC4D
MRILVTGKTGQIAQSLQWIGRSRDIDIVTVGRPELDLLNPSTIPSTVRFLRPDVIVSAAAYTAVEDAELEKDTAFAINSTGAKAVAQAARELRVPLIHLSTDYVFSGDKATPYIESDPTAPTSVYGASKLSGERGVAKIWENHAILRTAWVYSPYGKNFLKTMLKLAKTNKELRVVADQIGSPTSGLELAVAILKIAHRMITDSRPNLRGIFHLSGRGQASWAEFAEAIFLESRRFGGPFAEVRLITSRDYPSAVIRPKNSRLCGAKIKEAYGIDLPEWNTSLIEIMHAIQQNQVSS